MSKKAASNTMVATPEQADECKNMNTSNCRGSRAREVDPIHELPHVSNMNANFANFLDAKDDSNTATSTAIGRILEWAGDLGKSKLPGCKKSEVSTTTSMHVHSLKTEELLDCA
jgi:hypothetical protein